MEVFENESIKDIQRCIEISYNVRANKGNFFENENIKDTRR